MKVSNINLLKHEINYKKSIFDKLISDNLDLLPNINHETLSFQLTKTNVEFANAIRRVVTNELEINNLYVDMSEIKSDDKFILSNLIKDRLELICINQDIPLDCKFKIHVNNNTLDIKKITTKDLILQNNKHLDIKTLFNTNILICYLNSNKYLNVSDIIIKSNTGIENGKYALCNVHYKNINTEFTIPSLNNDTTDFEFKFNTNGNIKPKQIINKTVLILNKRLTVIEDNIKNNSKVYNNYQQELVESINLYIIKNNDIYNYYINNETHTIGNLLVRYIYDIYPEIELVNYTIEHPLKKQVIINIKHSDHNKLILDAIKNIKKDLTLFQSFFT